ncbi:hypothetical protein BH10PLA1_BH10PLA1_03570 [soil metagenome]
MALPPEILDRITHVLDFHKSSKLVRETVAKTCAPDIANKPSPYRLFESAPKVVLPTKLLDCPESTIELMSLGLDAVPDSHMRPPQDLKTLASWLFYSAAITQEVQTDAGPIQLRSSPSSGALYPCEIYVAAFAIDGLDPGFYHFSVREFALRKLRNGPETLWQIKRGRPDLEFIKTVPGALLVTTNFSRAAWKYQKRGYRHALLDAGHQTENISIAGRGLGIQTMVRLRLTELTTRELLGIPPHADFGMLEPVQSMVIWADQADHPLQLPKLEGDLPSLPPIHRQPLSPKPMSYGSIVAVHSDCTDVGVPIREIRPPVTELSPLPPKVDVSVFDELEEMQRCTPLRQTFLSRRSPKDFAHRAIGRDDLATIARIAFRGGSYFPLFPRGPHVALVRPFWILHDVVGMEPGIWYYHPPRDGWSLLRPGRCRADSKKFATDQEFCGNAGAVCWMSVNLSATMSAAGPDIYRLANLEAGIAGQRMVLAAQSLGMGGTGVASFYDDELRKFLGIDRTHWEMLYAVAIGYAGEPPAAGAKT